MREFSTAPLTQVFGLGLTNERSPIRHADGVEAAWWFGVMVKGSKRRAVRALRILVEAVK